MGVLDRLSRALAYHGALCCGTGGIDAVEPEVLPDVMQNIRQSQVFTLAHNVVRIPITVGAFYSAFGWMLSPSIAAAVMALSLVSIITNVPRLQIVRL